MNLPGKSGTFAVGQLVERRDNEGEARWRRGYVTSVDPLKVTYHDDDPAETGFTWDEVRPVDEVFGDKDQRSRRFRIRAQVVKELGLMSSCIGCCAIRDAKDTRNHSDECRSRVEKHLSDKGDAAFIAFQKRQTNENGSSSGPSKEACPRLKKRRTEAVMPPEEKSYPSALSSGSLAPHLVRGSLPRPDDERPDYILVIPSYNRPKNLAEKTMRLVLSHRIPLDRVFVFVASETASGQTEDEYTRYRKILVPLGLPASNIVVGVRGIMHQRNFIVNWALKRYAPLKHIVSFDDDLEGLFYKQRDRFHSNGAELGTLKEVEIGGVEAWISHAAEAMAKTKSYIWSLNPSHNPYFMRSDIISTSNGMVNGYLYGFLVRPDQDLQVAFMNATEDCERSVRFFSKDKIVLRYKMYTAKTKCFKNEGGIQDDYCGFVTMDEKNDARKIDEERGHELIAKNFPTLYSATSCKSRKLSQTMGGSFLTNLNTRHTEFPYGLTSSLQPRKFGEGRTPSDAQFGDGRNPSDAPASTAQPSETRGAPCPVAVCGDKQDSPPSKQPRLSEEDWSCSACTCLNRAVALACSACGKIKESDGDGATWSCLRCLTLSPSDERSCVGCGLPSTENKEGAYAVFVDSDSDGEGQCGRERGSIEIPDKPDRSVVAAFPAVVPVLHPSSSCTSVGMSGWQCRVCTYVNDKEEAPICEMCLTERNPPLAEPSL